MVVENRPNSTLLNAALGLSMGCAVVANLALLVRLFERRVGAMSIISIAFLSIHGESWTCEQWNGTH